MGEVLRTIPILLLLIGLLPAAGAAETASFEPVAKLIGADTAAGDEFGSSVALDGDRLIVGAYLDDDLGAESGSAYLFERDANGSDWREVAKILAPDGLAGDKFGKRVALSGETVVVAAEGYDESRLGYAYVVEQDADGSWNAVAKLQAEDGLPNGSFGDAVAISGDTVVIGARLEDGPGGFRSNDGAVYVFERNAGGPGNWGQVAKLRAAKACGYDRNRTACGWQGDEQFGVSVAVSDRVLVVGGGLFHSYIYLFQRTGVPGAEWTRVNRIVPKGFGQADFTGFGRSLAIDGQILLAGAEFDNQGREPDADEGGAAYVFEPDPGGLKVVRQAAKFYAPDGERGDKFGRAVALSGATAVIGAPKVGQSVGYAYIFHREEGVWSAVIKLEPAEIDLADNFGHAVAISGGTAVVGAFGDDDRGSFAGAVYVFEEILVDSVDGS